MGAKQISFGPFSLDRQNECLWHGSQAISLRPKPFAVLKLLLAHAGQLVSKQQLLDSVWPGTFVGDAVLKDSIRQLREALNDDAGSPRNFARLAENWLNSDETEVGTAAGKFARYELSLKGRSEAGKPLATGLEVLLKRKGRRGRSGWAAKDSESRPSPARHRGRGCGAGVWIRIDVVGGQLRSSSDDNAETASSGGE